MVTPQQRLEKLRDDLWFGRITLSQYKDAAKADEEVLELVLNEVGNLIADELEEMQRDVRS